MPFRRRTKVEARERIAELVAQYRAQAPDWEAPTSAYTETETRVQFIDKMLDALGWDVSNEDGAPQVLTDVVMERTGTGDEGESWGRPDYRLRREGKDRLPVEAKKPSVHLGSDSAPALQARRYGWSMNLPAAVLTNFAETVIFDTTVTPEEGDAADVAVIPGCCFTVDDYVERFDELWDRLAYEVVASDQFYDVYQYTEPPRGQSPFDQRFLDQFRRWRLVLATEIAAKNTTLGSAEVGRRTQRVLNALLFLRVCEDRDIGRYSDLLDSAASRSVEAAFTRADRVFNAGMFTALGGIVVGDDALLAVVREMYWPRTQFAFGVLGPDVLAGVYEQYLAERVSVAADRTVTLQPKPELTHAGGVVPTPDYVVDRLNQAALGPLLMSGVPKNLAILDLSEGSGPFLLDALKKLIAAAERAGEEVGLAERAALVKEHLFGVDIDAAAVEVTKLSLLLAVLGEASIDPTRTRQVLPDLSHNVVVGNSVVRGDFDTLVPEIARDVERRAAVAPTDLRLEFGTQYPAGGFDVIVGNPPYVRIQTLMEYLPDHLAYIRQPGSGYTAGESNNPDLSLAFIERALELLAPNGRLAYIAPHRFTTHLSASGVRLKLGRRLERLVHFGVEQVFPNRTTYTALIIAGPSSPEPATIEFVSSLDAWRGGQPGRLVQVERGELTAAPWPIPKPEQRAAFEQMQARSIGHLGDPEWVSIFVGVQTSRDKVFLVTAAPFAEGASVVEITDGYGQSWSIETGILKAALNDQRIDVFDGQPDANAWAIFPYEIVAPQRPGGRLTARVLRPDEMERRYPLALAYLQAHRATLENRDVTPDPGDSFWAYGRSQSLTTLDEPKLIVRVLSLAPRYAQDDSGLVVTGGGDGGPYYLLRPTQGCPYSIKTVQAILSHPVVDLFVTVNGRQYRGAYAVHRKAFLARVPVPELTLAEQAYIDERVTELQGVAIRLRHETDSAISSSLGTRRLVLQSEVESVISAAYGLTRAMLARLDEAGA